MLPSLIKQCYQSTILRRLCHVDDQVYAIPPFHCLPETDHPTSNSSPEQLSQFQEVPRNTRYLIVITTTPLLGHAHGLHPLRTLWITQTLIIPQFSSGIILSSLLISRPCTLTYLRLWSCLPTTHGHNKILSFPSGPLSQLPAPAMLSALVRIRQTSLVAPR